MDPVCRQSRLHSLIESLTNVVVGFVIAVCANYTVLPLFGFHPNVGESAEMAMIFMWITLIRSYLLRRLFNRWHQTFTRRAIG